MKNARYYSPSKLLLAEGSYVKITFSPARKRKVEIYDKGECLGNAGWDPPMAETCRSYAQSLEAQGYRPFSEGEFQRLRALGSERVMR